MVWRAAERTPDSVSWRACGSTMTARKPTANLTLIRRGRLLPPPLFLAPQPRPPPRPPPGHAAGTAPIPTQTVTPDKRFHVVEPRAPEALTGSFVVRMFVPPPRATLPRTRRRADRRTDADPIFRTKTDGQIDGEKLPQGVTRYPIPCAGACASSLGDAANVGDGPRCDIKYGN